MSPRTIQCPVCRLALPADTAQCPDCGQDLSVLAHLYYRVEILYNQALEQARTGDLKRAIRCLEEARDADAAPDAANARVLIVLGKLYAQDGRPADARDAFDQALARAPDSAEAAAGLRRLDEMARAAQQTRLDAAAAWRAWQQQAARAQRWRTVAWVAAGFGLGVLALLVGQVLQHLH